MKLRRQDFTLTPEEFMSVPYLTLNLNSGRLSLEYELSAGEESMNIEGRNK